MLDTSFLEEQNYLDLKLVYLLLEEVGGLSRMV